MEAFFRRQDTQAIRKPTCVFRFPLVSLYKRPTNEKPTGLCRKNSADPSGGQPIPVKKHKKRNGFFSPFQS